MWTWSVWAPSYCSLHFSAWCSGRCCGKILRLLGAAQRDQLEIWKDASHELTISSTYLLNQYYAEVFYIEPVRDLIILLDERRVVAMRKLLLQNCSLSRQATLVISRVELLRFVLPKSFTIRVFDIRPGEHLTLTWLYQPHRRALGQAKGIVVYQVDRLLDELKERVYTMLRGRNRTCPISSLSASKAKQYLHSARKQPTQSANLGLPILWSRDNTASKYLDLIVMPSS